MLVVENNTNAVNWGINGAVNPLIYGGDVVVVFDPSKTNMAMLLGTPDGTILNTIEFSGNNRRSGPTMDTTQYCQEVRAFLKRYLAKAHIYMVAVEQAIHKKGFEYYTSNMVLTEIRANILNFFREIYGIEVIEINNWSWKHATLPEGYRGQFQKGSKKFFQDKMPNSPYAHYFEADMTDCICIYWYLLSQKCGSYVMLCNRSETAIVDFEYAIYPDSGYTDQLKEVTYNDAYSIEDNIAFYVNRLSKPFALTVPVNKLSMEQIYKSATFFENKDIFTKNVKVVACRVCGC